MLALRFTIVFSQEQNSGLAPALITVWWFCCCFFVRLSWKVLLFTSKSQSTSQKTLEKYWDEDTFALSVTEQAQNSVRKSPWALPALGNSAALNNLLSGINSSPIFFFSIAFFSCFLCLCSAAGWSCACSCGWLQECGRGVTLVPGTLAVSVLGRVAQGESWPSSLWICAHFFCCNQRFKKKINGKKNQVYAGASLTGESFVRACIQAWVSQCQFSANGALWAEWEMKQNECFCLC